MGHVGLNSRKIQFPENSYQYLTVLISYRDLIVVDLKSLAAKKQLAKDHLDIKWGCVFQFSSCHHVTVMIVFTDIILAVKRNVNT